MKKVLFTIGRLDNGGVAKSLLSLLSTIDKKKYDVSLLVVGYDAGHHQDVPEDVRVITDPVLADVDGGFHGLKRLVLHGHVFLALGSILRLVLSRFNRGWGGLLLSKLMPVVTKEEYDLIIDYNGQQMLYYMVDKLKAKKKVSFFHSDYKKWSYYKNVDAKYYPKVDAIFTISPMCVQSMKEVFPEISSKVLLMENISNVNQIRDLSNKPVNFVKNHQYMLVTVGHVSKTKGADMALFVAKRMKCDLVDFEWVFVGEVHNDYGYQKFIIENGLTENVRLIGPKPNPYPYMQMADIYVQLSRFEGKSISLDEAKILSKPIVITNFSSVNDQFTDRKNASICQMNVDDANKKIMELLNNDGLRKLYIESLKKEVVDNSSEVEKLYEYLK